MIEDLSIVIPVLNEARYISKLLNSITKQVGYKNLEVIVVDGLSEDNTISIVKSFYSKIENLCIVSSKRGIGYQRNIGAKKAKYDHLLFLDADVILPDNFIEKLFPKIDSDEQFVAFIDFRIAEYDILSSLIFWVIYPLTLSIIYHYKLTPGFALLTTLNNHRTIKGFREDMLIAEDHDYGKRSIKAGTKYKFIMNPAVFYSIRRAKKMGKVNFLLFHLKLLLFMRKNGLSSLGKYFEYPFGDY